MIVSVEFVHDVRLYSVLDTAVISSDDVCFSVVCMFSVIWSELLMTSASCCYLPRPGPSSSQLRFPLPR